MADKSDWVWDKGLPTNQAEFELMMDALDGFLASQGRQPAQRPLVAVAQLSMRFGYSEKPLLPMERIEISHPFDAGWCVKEAWLWYETVYGGKLAIDPRLGSVVLIFRGSLWRMRMPRTYGSVEPFIDTNLRNEGIRLSMSGGPPASINVLCLVDSMTQPLADRLTPEEKRYIFSVYRAGKSALTRLDSFAGDDFFEQARAEYRQSVEALLAGDWAKARYDTALCIEKIFKGTLRRSGKPFPRSGKEGHDIAYLGDILFKELGIALPSALLEASHCSTKVRYGETPSTRDDGLSAHRALLELMPKLP